MLSLLHMIPIPNSIWQVLAWREDVTDVDKIIGFSGTWRPFSMDPMKGWDAFISLFPPLAVILLGVQLSRDELFDLLPVVIALTVFSGLLGLLQVIGDPQGSLYFYQLTNKGSAVGLFANRNHAATLLGLLFPMLAIYASIAKREVNSAGMRPLIALAVAIVLVPLILVTGSRSGLVSAVIGIAAAAVLYRQSASARRGKHDRFSVLQILGGVGVISVALLTFFLSRAEAINRLFIYSSGGDKRSDFWGVSINLFWKNLPMGSGSGSFANAYQVSEPTRLLDPTYLNRAHNDWVEVAVTFGLPGIIILFVTLIGFGFLSYRLWRSSDGTVRAVAFGRLASVMILMIAVASVADYPLRTPTMLAIFALCALWFVESGLRRSSHCFQR